ncbi:hypothetical protein [Halobacillus mangrovi]|uniref:hypothetical protein n=1 Tax=Halobacillus mangrovi TaxID=402384 RepID=UPI003D98CE6C
MSFSRELSNGNTQAMSPQQIKEMCQKNLYQLVQFETTDGNRYAGILHSYDQNQMYVIMPSGNQSTQQQSSDNRFFFPFFGPFGLFGFPFFGLRWFGPFYPYWW